MTINRKPGHVQKAREILALEHQDALAIIGELLAKFEPATCTIYEAYTNSDLTEGRGSHVHIAYCESPFTAMRLVKGRGVMGCDACVQEVHAYYHLGRWHVPAFIQGPNVEDRNASDLKKRTEAAVAKATAAGLTAEEIELIARHQQ